MQDLNSFDNALKNQYLRRKKMPLSKHFGGHGTEVMESMKKTYGPRAEKVFYATDNARKNRPDSKIKSAMRQMMRKNHEARGGSKAGRDRG